MMAMASGCATKSAVQRAMVAPYRPSNVQQAAPVLPDTLRRVAVLPMGCESGEPGTAEGVEAMSLVMAKEIGKLRAFETVSISASQLRALTGSSSWSAHEALPSGFFERIQSATAADAVLFSRLTTYRAYPPLAVGLGFKLVDTRSQLIWWSVDEVFDAGSVAVAKAAEGYAASELEDARVRQDTSMVLLSPSRFGQYAIHSCLATMPER